MNEFAIKVEQLGKQYHIGGAKAPYKTLRESLVCIVSSPFRLLRTKFQGANIDLVNGKETIWALKDVSFEVKHGEVVGIIGRNGAGKSTLLKILSHITEPTEGRVRLRGRVGCLLEVGTGFHPELTGRENIYLNGTILGMRKTEIKRKFDEIVAFAETEKFLDTPAKHYSSGMYVRLAFAVAAHLEPEILLVDEVLAVGDAAFQEKCLGKMGDVAKEGRTVLFVSHNMAAVSNLCQNTYMLEKGRIEACGQASDVINHYMQSFKLYSGSILSTRTDRIGNGSVKFTDVKLLDHLEQVTNTVMAGSDISLELHYSSSLYTDINKASATLVWLNNMGVPIFCCWSDIFPSGLKNLKPSGKLVCHIPKLPVIPGRYSLYIALNIGGQVTDSIRDAASVQVIEGDFFGTGKLPPSQKGVVYVPHEWWLRE